jgi:homoserine O-acetyltransferase/O-succinyltransferase
MRARIATLLCLLLAAASARASEQKFAELGDFKLQSGQVIKNCRIGYRTHGLLNAEHSNVVLFPTWFGGTSKDLDAQIDTGSMIDPAGLFVIAVDALGNGVSSSPSNSREQPGQQFPAITIADMVESQRRLLVDVLKVPRVRAVFGISMGGMQAFQWMVSHPEMMERAVPIVGTTKQTSQDLLLWKSQLRTIDDHRTSPAELQRGMKAVGRIHALHLWTGAFHVGRTKLSDVDKLLDSQEKSALASNPDDWAAQLRAMIDHDVFKAFNGSEDEAAKAVKAKALVIVVTTDLMVNATPALRFAEKIKAKTIVLTNDGGHLGIGMDGDKVVTAVRAFLYGRD